jgi:hypothetical protein
MHNVRPGLQIAVLEWFDELAAAEARLCFRSPDRTTAFAINTSSLVGQMQKWLSICNAVSVWRLLSNVCRYHKIYREKGADG